VRVVLSAGGTAGHVNPALAVARKLTSQGIEVLYAGCPDSIEERLVGTAGLPFAGFSSQGLNRRKPWTFPATAIRLNRGRMAAMSWLAGVRPDVVATFGGYASLPTGMAAAGIGLPLLVHEQNAKPGLANRVLARKSQILAISDERAITGFRTRAKTVVTGNPLREELFGIDVMSARQTLGFSVDAKVLLVFGGSLGAHHINEAILNLAPELLERFDNLEVLHLTGTVDFEWAAELLRKKGISESRWQLRDYCYQMGEAYASADLVLARAGATTLAELTALGKASLLVPYPYAAADEQTANANRLTVGGAASMWPDGGLDQPGFGALLIELLADDPTRAKMQAQARTLGKPDAAAVIAGLIIDLADNRVT
jgi:UDP-N-acetylglucosamine--N-acetylmuramyl-(pentapeptide) pyrophosphoryl-undecaprenol N-acetylglucosamine transferase